MWLIIVLILLFTIALGGGGYAHSRRAYWGWSPAAFVLVVAIVLFLSGHLTLQ